MNEPKITAELLNNMRPELNEAVKAVAEKYGVKIHFGNGRYTDLTATYTVELSLAAKGDWDPDKVMWDNNCRLIGMKPEDFGKAATHATASACIWA